MPSRPSSSSAPREAPPTSLERVSTTRTRKPALLELWRQRTIFAAWLLVCLDPEVFAILRSQCTRDALQGAFQVALLSKIADATHFFKNIR
jgi:hypothetical protein